MALEGKKISELVEILSNALSDETLYEAVEGGVNYKLKHSEMIKKITLDVTPLLEIIGDKIIVNPANPNSTDDRTGKNKYSITYPYKSLAKALEDFEELDTITIDSDLVEPNAIDPNLGGQQGLNVYIEVGEGVTAEFQNKFIASSAGCNNNFYISGKSRTSSVIKVSGGTRPLDFVGTSAVESEIQLVNLKLDHTNSVMYASLNGTPHLTLKRIDGKAGFITSSISSDLFIDECNLSGAVNWRVANLLPLSDRLVVIKRSYIDGAINITFGGAVAPDAGRVELLDGACSGTISIATTDYLNKDFAASTVMTRLF